ncbi:MAG: hypothetical protein ABIG67_08895 [Pseudomonadota bacterium]
MKRIIFLIAVLFVMSAFNLSKVSAQQMGPGMMGPGYGYQQPEGWNYCPNCGGYLGPGGGYGMGPGMMGGMMGRGYGMGPGMMGPQYGPQSGPGYQGPQYQQPQKPMDENDAKELLENYIQSTRNPNLKLGKLEDKGNSFEAEIQTKDGSLVDKVVVDKRTGWMRSGY